MALTEEERALYQTRLTDAEQSLHLIVTGQQAKVYVDQNGERVEYQMTNTDRLRAYIFELRTLLGKKTVVGPMNIWV